MTKSGLFAAVLVFSFSILSLADEGMWLFNSLPHQQLKEKYGFTASQEWLDHVMRSSVRFNSGGSGSFVSSDGLVLTNHHVAADTIQKVSTPEKDYYKNGFYARTLEEEIPAPDLELNQLISIEDVTSRVRAAVSPGMNPGDAYKAKLAEISKIESESLSQTGLRSDVVTLYGGGAYHLYRYKKYTDVRVVFAPEFSIAFFGGDPDNFEYPRYDLDMSILRVYENGKPAKIEHFLKWSETGAAEDELVFVSGHPGSTSRLFTVAALEFLRDNRLPFRLDYLRKKEKALLEYSARGTEQARQAKGELFYIQNSRKAMDGRLKGLKDPQIMNEKVRFEQDLKSKVQANPDLQKYLGAWDQISEAQRVFAGAMHEYFLIEGGWGFSSKLYTLARHLVRMAAEDQKPNSERLPEYKDSARKSLEQSLYSDAPIYLELEEFDLSRSFEFLRDYLPADHGIITDVLGFKSPQERAVELVRGTRLKDPAERRRIAALGQKGIDESNDPMIRLAAKIDGYSRLVRKYYEDKVKGPEIEAYPQISSAIFAVYGMNRYPDATFTLRLSFGTVKGYEQEGQKIAPWTTMGGAFEHERRHSAQEPWKLPDSWHRSKENIRLETPMNFVSTTDIIGGNSGSPVVNRKGELVGLIFDGNIQSLVGDYIFDETQNRAVSVHSTAMLEALRKIYSAADLADRLGH